MKVFCIICAIFLLWQKSGVTLHVTSLKLSCVKAVPLDVLYHPQLFLGRQISSIKLLRWQNDQQCPADSKIKL